MLITGGVGNYKRGSGDASITRRIQSPSLPLALPLFLAMSVCRLSLRLPLPLLLSPFPPRCFTCISFGPSASLAHSASWARRRERRCGEREEARRSVSAGSCDASLRPRDKDRRACVYSIEKIIIWSSLCYFSPRYFTVALSRSIDSGNKLFGCFDCVSNIEETGRSDARTDGASAIIAALDSN